MEGLYTGRSTVPAYRLFAVEETDTKWEYTPAQIRSRHRHEPARGAADGQYYGNPATVGAPETPDGRVYNGEEICLFYYPNTTAESRLV